MTLANGEVRRRWTNPERTARIELLCRIGMVSKSLAHHDIETLCPLPHDLRCALPHDLASELPDSRSISAAALSGASEPRSDLAAYSAWFSASDVPPASSQAGRLASGAHHGARRLTPLGGERQCTERSATAPGSCARHTARSSRPLGGRT